MQAFFRQVLVTVLFAVAIFFALQTTIQTSIVVGRSMEPSFYQGQRLLINKAVYHLDQPERGDVIIFHPPNSSGADYIKRIIALPDETVEIKMGTVYVNGSPLNEPYIKNSPDYTLQQLDVMDGEYFVLGDNRNNSNDSHNGWTVPRENIVGKAWISIWPPGTWGLISGNTLLNEIVR